MTYSKENYPETYKRSSGLQSGVLQPGREVSDPEEWVCAK